MSRCDSEEGTSYFYQMGHICIDWLHRGHTICAIVQSEFNTSPVHANNLKIYFNGKEVTEEYLEALNDKPVRIRSTMANIAMIVDIIDKNMDEFEATKEEGDVWL